MYDVFGNMVSLGGSCDLFVEKRQVFIVSLLQLGLVLEGWDRISRHAVLGILCRKPNM